MDGKEFCKEIEEILAEIRPEKVLIKKILSEIDSQYTFNAYRYHYKKGEAAYEKFIKFRKAKNLIEYLLDLEDNKE